MLNDFQTQERDALVILSGGQDSTTCLYWALEKFKRVRTITFDYGQRHDREIGAAKAVAQIADVSFRAVKITALAELGGNSLTDSKMKIQKHSKLDADLPNTFVPGRNLLFLTLAAAYAYQFEIRDLVLGVCETDYSGYPDCRDQTIQAMRMALVFGLERKFEIHTPLMYSTKKQTVEFMLQHKSPSAWLALGATHTCYAGQNPACGKCPACLLRAKGFAEAGVPDPAIVKQAK